MYANPQLWELTLERWPAAAWDLLVLAASSFDEPFRAPAVASSGPDGPELRTVILREVLVRQRQLLFYTDARSPKVGQMDRLNTISWMFYDPHRRLQIRARGKASLHGNDLLATACWDKCSEAARQNYCAVQAPGSSLESPSQDVATGGRGARENFLVVATELSHMDVLLLGAHSNRRVSLAWDGSGWTAGWRSP